MLKAKTVEKVKLTDSKRERSEIIIFYEWFETGWYGRKRLSTASFRKRKINSSSDLKRLKMTIF